MQAARENHIQQRLLAIFYDYQRTNVYVIPAFVMFVAVILSTIIPVAQTMGWAVLFTLYFVVGHRFIMDRYHAELPRISVAYFGKAATIYAFVAASFIGILPWTVFDKLDPNLMIVLTVWFALPAAITIPYMASYLPIYVGCNAVLLIPLGLYTAFRWDFDPFLGKLVAGWIVLHAVHMYVLAKSHNRHLREHYGQEYDLEAQKRRTEQVLIQKNQFLRSASHDIRQPLDALGLLIEALRQAGNEADTIFETINKNIAAQKSIYDKLLMVSRLDSDELELNYSRTNVQDLVADTVELFSEVSVQRRKVVITCEGVGVVFTDQALLTSLLSNLIGNALKYSEDDVHINIADQENRVVIQIKDSGIGIPASSYEQIFEPFYRIESAEVGLIRGAGLGLSIVKQICELLNVELGVDSKLGAGSVFTITMQRPSDD